MNIGIDLERFLEGMWRDVCVGEADKRTYTRNGYTVVCQKIYEGEDCRALWFVDGHEVHQKDLPILLEENK